MNTEEKAKAYNKVREKIALRFGSNVAEEIFSEFEMSEDEKIRKELIHLVEKSHEQGGYALHKYEASRMIAWLEKQGELKSIWHNEDEEPKRDSLILLIMQSRTPIVAKIIEPNHTFNHGEKWAYIDDLLEKQGEKQEDPRWKFLNDLLIADDIHQMSVNEEMTIEAKTKAIEALSKLGISKLLGIEKQGEQKPTNKVESKFKVKYAGSEYNVLEVKDIDGITFYGIEDEPNHIDYVKAENCEIISGYAIKENGSPYPTKPAVFSEQKPAWSEEDIRNIENIDSVLFYDKDLPEETCMRLRNWLQSLKPNKDMVEALRTEYEKGKADGITEMKKYIDIMDKDNINDFAYQCAYDLSKDWLYEHASWDDVQIACKLGAKWYENHHKVQWSEEDERMIDNIIFELEENQENICGVGYKIDWLKQLKQRHTWKPSEDQMHDLKMAIDSFTFEPDYLEELYNDLKKLKGE